MGKGGRNHRGSKYRVVLRSPEYMKKKRALEERKRAMRAGEIYTGDIIGGDKELKVELALNRIPGKPKVLAIIGDKVVES